MSTDFAIPLWEAIARYRKRDEMADSGVIEALRCIDYHVNTAKFLPPGLHRDELADMAADIRKTLAARGRHDY